MTQPSPDRREPWSPAKLIGFRFAFIYLVLYGVPSLMADLPLVAWLSEKYQALWNPLAGWVGDALLGIEVPPRVPNGSGDQLAAWVDIVCLLLVAAVGTIAWSIADRRRPAYRALGEVLRIYLRYFLAFTMLIYGMVKVLKSQFPEPSPGRLLVPIGQTSPMGLLWTVMGHSTAYTVLAGLAEVTGGALLLFRRTTGLGALVLVGVLGNVVALNYSYDVPVKLFSTHLLLMAFILLALDARRMVDFLVLNRPTRPAELGAPPVPARWRRGVVAGKVLVLTAIATYAGWMSIDAYRTYGDGAARNPLHGAYRVLAMERGGAAVPPADPTGWRQVGISQVSFLVVGGDGALARYAASYDPASRTLQVTDRGNRSGSGSLTASPQAGGELHLDGVVAGEPVSLRLRRMEEKEFVLLHRGFHWVSDAPFNR